VLATLGLLTLPLLDVPSEAQAAQRELAAAARSLRDGDLPSARESVAKAREHVDAAQDSAQGLGGDVWSSIPVAGTAVDDARHLVQVLDDATAIGEVGVKLYPSVAGKRANLFRDQQVDGETLEAALEGAREAAEHVSSAQSSLDEVRASTPFVGDQIAARRDEAAEQVDPMADALTQLEPMLDELRAVLGFEGRRRYLIAMLNPAELRYSGGAALSFARMSWDEGRLELGKSFNLTDDARLRTRLTWPKLKGNRFHRRDTLLANSTFAPSWSVSGEELLRAWRRATRQRYDGVIALDVVTMSGLLEVTGPANVPGFGQLTADNLVETLVGSYDDYYPDPTAQDQHNAAVVVALQQKLFSGGEYVAKARSLKAAADGRHLAVYFRDPDQQAAFAGLGLDGDLTKPAGDYVGVFTQSTVGSKVDYWQRRSITLDVDLGRDGSATNRLGVLIHNDTPPFVLPVPDPRSGYFTRWANIAAAVFLPAEASVESFSAGGQRWEGEVRRFYDHSFVSQPAVIPPGESARLKASYSVPGAAEMGESDALTYRLAMDPQGTVFPASAEVTVHLPDGYRATALPEGWSTQGDTLTFRTEALEASQEWEIAIEPSS
jgi:hypothetical protein